ncbi:MAG TPA: S1/P1 nuclease [Pyrinomonadaceae bacterium]|nr:S1/P1 nuclease [Pyrinomonadaceae bacterium]
MKAVKVLPRAALLLLLVASAPTPSLAWGDEGHRVVARIAAHYVTKFKPGLANKIDAILKAGNDPCATQPSLADQLACVATWADPPVKDERPYTANWHFVDIPINPNNLPQHVAYDAARDCREDPERGDCLILAADRMEHVLGNENEQACARAEALKFIVHLIGDLHQPLHGAERNKDRGGNDVRVWWNDSPTNLHSLWDTGLILRIYKDDFGTQGDDRRFADALSAKLDALPQADMNKLTQGTIIQWAEASHDLAGQFAYGLLPKTAACGPQPKRFCIDETYYQKSRPVVEDQLKRGGVRLAKILAFILK